MSHLTRDPIDAAALLERAGQRSDGGAACYIGTVRDNDAGRPVRALEYEAHEPMAEAELGRLCREAARRFEVGRVEVVHRLGRLEVGDVAVAVVVAAPHRGAALDATRWLIDTLKADVPIFKKEVYADEGSHWVGD
jgi:molybdopterin synthase catalytic subunit